MDFREALSSVRASSLLQRNARALQLLGRSSSKKKETFASFFGLMQWNHTYEKNQLLPLAVSARHNYGFLLRCLSTAKGTSNQDFCLLKWEKPSHLSSAQVLSREPIAKRAKRPMLSSTGVHVPAQREP